VNHLAEIAQNNRNLKLNILKNGREVKLSYPSGAFVHFSPGYDKRTVQFGYGHTPKLNRGSGLGTRLRKYGVQAARAANVSLFHEGMIIENNHKNLKMPISTYIIRKLGAEPAHGLPHPRTSRVTKPQLKSIWPSIFRFHRYPLRKKNNGNTK
jgi:hypothetical protein